MLDTSDLLQQIHFPPLVRKPLKTLQINLGYRCNLQCRHCHVNAGPTRTESMSRQTLNHILQFIETYGIKQVDITGGAPEMHPNFIDLLKQLQQLQCNISVRSNLVILTEPDFQDYYQWLEQIPLTLMASLPCYLAENVDTQRGKGVYDKSIQVLQNLNQIGYGDNPTRPINLIYNPQGADLPAAQEQLEQDYKRYLRRHYDIHFNHLLTLTNQPIKRFGSWLLSKKLFTPYMQMLQDSFNPATIKQVMCREQISIDYNGQVYDCDFNQMLNMPLSRNGKIIRIQDYHPQLDQQIPIKVAGHCYACTAGNGSSCSGQLEYVA